MNIWGYQRKSKAIALALKKEEAKKEEKQCRDKIRRLIKASKDCLDRIRQLKKTRKKGHRLHKKVKRRKRASKY